MLIQKFNSTKKCSLEKFNNAFKRFTASWAQSQD